MTRARKRKQPEGGVVNVCLRWLLLNGCYVWRHNTGKLPDRFGRPVSFGHKGSSDVVGLNRRGTFIGVECKYGKNVLQPEQKAFKEEIEKRGGIYVVARSVDDLEARREEILGG